MIIAQKHVTDGRKHPPPSPGVRERPIIFSGEMVRAILDGRKTQTRRVLKPQADEEGLSRPLVGPDVWLDTSEREYRCPFGKPGDRLWVRESWATGWNYGGQDPVVFYRSTNDGLTGSETYPVRDVKAGKFGIPSKGPDCTAPGSVKWRSPIFMPRWASRLTLEVTGVRVERLQDISDADAIAEGIESNRDEGVIYYGPLNRGHADPRVAFSWLWDTTNAKRGHPWNSNCWVWAIEFKRIEAAL